MDQLAEFKTLEAPAARAVFAIPGEEISGEFDLQYYFEVLGPSSGWFYPDPAAATPYYVVETQGLTDGQSGR
jgi:hypothetical protein